MNPFVYDFLHVTEIAALASYPWVGKGNKIEADQAATNSMRLLLNEITMEGVVVIGEGEMDEAPMLYIGENVGTGVGPKIDLAVDPIDGTTQTSNGQNDAITVIAAAPKGTLLHAPDMYMEKIAVGPKAAGRIDIDAPIKDNLSAVAKATNKQINELTVVIQDRERHAEIINVIRDLGAKTIIFQEGDIIPSIATCVESLNIDLFLGIGGAPEGVLAAVGIKALGGEMQARLLPKTDKEFQRCKDMGIEQPTQSLSHRQLVGTDRCSFVATGITSNMLLKGIRREQEKIITNSIVLNGNDKRLRYIETTHDLNCLQV